MKHKNAHLPSLNAGGSSPAVAPPPSISTTIARSMSRYKGNRQANRPIGVPLPLRQAPQAYGAGEPGNMTEEQFISRTLRNEKTSGSRPTTAHGNTANGEMSRDRSDTVMSSSDHINGRLNGDPSSDGRQPLQQPQAPFSKERGDLGQHQSWPVGNDFAAPSNEASFPSNGAQESTSNTPNKAPWATSAKGTPARFDTFNKRSSRSKLEISKPMPLDLSHDEIRVHRQDRSNKRDSYSPRSPKSPLKRWSGSSREEIKKMISKPIPMAEPPAISEPRLDAPVSASQAAEQKVKIKYKDETIYAPVNASTTPTELIRYAQSQIPEMASQPHLVMLESFKKLGLERPLRKYEHIRDILNAWDANSHNHLSIVPSPSAGNDEDLNASTAPKTQPTEVTVNLYHSQKPGNWDKRYITLRADGQMFYSKKLGGEGISMCHLSDYDIYVPTARELKKRIKPPKNACFAVKSQQKSSIFVTTENFVHFFSTNDKKVAARWYKAIQEWRSWYLVYMLDQGSEGAAPSPNLQKNNHNNYSGPQRPSSSDAPLSRNFSTRRQQDPSSSSPTHPQNSRNNHNNPLTTYRPVPGSQAQARTSGSGSTPANPYNIPSVSLRPTSSESIHGISSSAFPLPPSTSSANHNPTGLLARHTSTTNGNSGVNSKLKPAGSGAYAPTLSKDFSLGSTTLVQDGTGGLKRAPSNAFRSRQVAAAANSGRISNRPAQHATAAGSRGPSQLPSHNTSISQTQSQQSQSSQQRSSPPNGFKPLVDLTPQYEPPPQHARKGRGLKPDVIPPGGLIDLANSKVEEAIKVPEARAWQRQAQQQHARPSMADAAGSSGSLPVRREDGGSRKVTPRGGVLGDDEPLGNLLQL